MPAASSAPAPAPELLALAEEISDIGYWQWTAGDETLFWSGGMYRIHGLSPDDFTPSLDTLPELYTAHDGDALRKFFDLAAQCADREKSIELRITRPNGDIRDVLAKCRPQYDQKGQFSGIFGTFQDISLRKQEERFWNKLYKISVDTDCPNNKKIRLILQASTEFLGLDTGLITRVADERNPDKMTVTDYFGSGKSSLKNKSLKAKKSWLADAFHADDVIARQRSKADPQPALSNLLYSEATLQSYIGVSITTGNKRYGVLSFTSSSPHYFTERDCATLRLITQWISDLVAKTQYIQALQSSEEELAEAVRKLEMSNQELSQFAHVCAHDLQEPLRAIRFFVGKLTEELTHPAPGKEEVDQSLHFIRQGSDRAQQMVVDLLAYAEIDRPDREPDEVDLYWVIHSLVRGELAAQIQETGATVEIAEMPEIIGHLLLLSRLFQNLISNALKFRASDRAPFITIRSEPYRGGWHCIVEDNGIGIPPEHHFSVFEMFKRLHSRQKYTGSGLGLAICQRVVERHRGKIWVESQPGAGTAFHFTLFSLPGGPAATS